MEPELLSQVFDLFARGVRWVNHMQSGLGIGLKLSKNFAELHGGTLKASSPGAGKGSTFTLSLPIHAAQGVGAMPDESGVAPQGPQSRRVLVVDDNVDAAGALVDMLLLWGHEAEAVFAGRPAVARAQAWRPEVVLLDISLPDIDGYEVARQLRSQDGSPHVLHLVAITGFGQEDDKERSRRAGFDDHLTKPVDLDALHQLLASTRL
jgi:CheY-like chemotaxis protein